MSTAFADLVPLGGHASRPAAAGVVPGTLFSCTDHDVVYQSDGAGWSVWVEGGAGGAVSDSYHHDQGVAATTWTVNHNLGRHPNVSVLDSAGSQVEVAVVHTSLNQVVLSLAYATSGTADCS